MLRKTYLWTSAIGLVGALSLVLCRAQGWEPPKLVPRLIVVVMESPMVACLDWEDENVVALLSGDAVGSILLAPRYLHDVELVERAVRDALAERIDDPTVVDATIAMVLAQSDSTSLYGTDATLLQRGSPESLSQVYLSGQFTRAGALAKLGPGGDVLPLGRFGLSYSENTNSDCDQRGTCGTELRIVSADSTDRDLLICLALGLFNK